MKRHLLLTVMLLASTFLSTTFAQSTMTFSSGASETGFSFSGFNAGGGTIWIANLGNAPGKITKSSGKWNVTSVLLGTPINGSGSDYFTITSDLGHSYSYTGATAGTVTLNWTCVSWIAFDRSSGSGISPDIDNVVYTTPTGPTTPTVTHTPSSLCSGDNVTLSISGTLNDATSWVVYSGGCGSGSAVASTAGTSVTFASTSTTTYYVRGEGCGLTGSCGSRAVTVTPADDASFSYGSTSYCTNSSDPTPTAVTSGTYASTTGLSINNTTGQIDVSASTPGGYTVTHTTTGTCPKSSTKSVTIYALDDASFSYSASPYCANASDPTPTAATSGTYSSTSGLSINNTTGQIDVSASTPNTYTVTHVTTGSCPNSSTQSVTIVAVDDATFSYASSSYCTNDADPTPTAATSGSYASGTGLSINSVSGEIDVSASTPGGYTVTHVTSGTCTTSTTQSITINATTSSTISPDVCNTYTSPSGKVKTSSASFLDTIPNAASCDSVITINLTVRHATSSSISPDVCYSYTSPSGKVKTSTVTFNDTIPNAASCDSVITINLTVRNATSSSISPNVCNSYTSPSGKVKTATETFNDTIPNAAGCDSLISISLTIKNSTAASISPDLCNTYTSPSGKVKTSSENFMDTIPNAVSCDSVITINLTVRHATTASISPDVCNTYTSPSGKVKTTTVTFNDTIPNAASCDSVITINLIVRHSTSATVTQTAIDTFTTATGAKITTTGTVVETISNDAGCDSVITYNLTIINRIFVDPSGSSSGTGDGWGQAMNTLDAALQCVNICNNSAEIWLKEGTYCPSNPGANNRNSSFVLTNINAQILGGFDGTETSASQRDPAANPTNLCGDIGIKGDPSDNAYHIMVIVDKRAVTGGEEVLNSDFLVNGINFQNGNANGGAVFPYQGIPINQNSGGGLVIVSQGSGREVSPNITNCTFNNNNASYGGAIFAQCQGGASYYTLSNSIFENNTSIYGAIYNDGTSGDLSPTINACVFNNNISRTSGAAIYNNAYNGTSSPTITNCVFSNNIASTGGALYNNGYKGTSSPAVYNCTFYNNTAYNSGGAIYNFGSLGTCSPNIKNCIFNTNNIGGNDDVNYSEMYSYLSSPTVNYSILQRDSSDYAPSPLTSLGSGSNNKYSTDPGFSSTSDLDGTDNTWRNADDGLMPASGSPAINAGTNTGTPTLDIRGATKSGTRDIGAYEVGGTFTP